MIRTHSTGVQARCAPKRERRWRTPGGSNPALSGFSRAQRPRLLGVHRYCLYLGMSFIGWPMPASSYSAPAIVTTSVLDMPMSFK